MKRDFGGHFVHTDLRCQESSGRRLLLVRGLAAYAAMAFGVSVPLSDRPRQMSRHSAVHAVPELEARVALVGPSRAVDAAIGVHLRLGDAPANEVDGGVATLGGCERRALLRRRVGAAVDLDRRPV